MEHHCARCAPIDPLNLDNCREPVASCLVGALATGSFAAVSPDRLYGIYPLPLASTRQARWTSGRSRSRAMARDQLG